MILPREIHSKRNKIRDAKILQIYSEDLRDETYIAKQFNLTQARISQILKDNAHLLLKEKDWEKVKRLNLIKTQLNREDVKKIAVSPSVFIDLWRKEFEKDVELNTITQFFSVEPNSKVKSRLDEIQTH